MTPDFLFFSGGAGTVRGQPFESLGIPVNGGVAGGKSFLGLSGEVRGKITDTISLVGFYDFGTVDTSSFIGSDAEYHSGAGLGVRYDLGGFGPLRLDLALPVQGETGERAAVLYRDRTGILIRRYAYPVVTTILIVTAPPVIAQEDDGGGSMLERFLQDTLSGDDQNVTVKGLQGALSARATIQEITVSDDEGVWLTIKDAELDWNRLALIRGRFSVNALTAQEIDIARTPGTTTKEAPPAFGRNTTLSTARTACFH